MTSAESVRIFCAANAAYAGPLCVMLVSLLINFDKNRKIEIYVVATNIPDEDRHKIETSIRLNRLDFDFASLHWLSPNLDALRGLHVNGWVDIETYVRLLASSVLPETIDKLLYLDSDLVVLSDVAPLYDSICGDNAVLAARDPGIAYVSSLYGVFNHAELGIPPKTPYFNSGVLLINLKRWREQNISNQILDYLRQHKASVHFWDQGALNAVLYNSWAEIDPMWNQIQTDQNLPIWKEIGLFVSNLMTSNPTPKIMHYTGPNKPWNLDRRPGYTYFFDYLDKTAYRTEFKHPHLEWIIGFKLNYILWRIKIFLFWKRNPQDILRVFMRTIGKTG